jgi:GAF domain-containing protein
MEGENNAIANMANLSALLKETFGFWWCGFYLVSDDQLVLGPFQGPVACTRIGYGKGVCGTAWKEKRSIVVDDVEKFPGHIACNSKSRSEIVLPIRDREGRVFACLDVDSDRLDAFDREDEEGLKKILSLLFD